MSKLSVMKENIGDFHVKEDYQTELRNNMEMFLDKIIEIPAQVISRNIHSVLSYISMACSLIVIIVIAYCVYKNRDNHPARQIQREDQLSTH